MNWIDLTTPEQLETIRDRSEKIPQVIFKHSTRCSISSVAKSRLERNNDAEEVDFYYLDLIKFRNISHKVADQFDVFHESPQVLLIKNRNCVYEESHSGIRLEELYEQLKHN
jgi:bacillithiol system protein YtxJ